MNDTTQKPGGDKPASGAAGSSVVAAPPPNPLLPRRCLHCGYNLLGTVDDGSCPECGGVYEPGAYMWTPTTRSHQWSRIMPLVIATVVLGVNLIGFAFGMRKTSSESAWMVPIGFVVFIVLFYMIYRQTSGSAPREYFVVTRDGIRFRLAYDDRVTREESRTWDQIERVIPARYDRTATVVFKSELSKEQLAFAQPGATCPFFQSSEEVIAFTALVEQRLREFHEKQSHPDTAASKPPQ